MNDDLKIDITKIKDSNHKAYKEFYTTYFPSVFDFIFYKAKDKELANDIAQETFYRIWINRTNIDTTKSIKSYTLRIANNLLIDHFRKKSTSNLPIEENAILENDEDEINTSDSTVEKIYKSLKMFPKKHSEVFLLSRVEGLKYKEIAEIYDVSPKTVEGWIAKITHHIKTTLYSIMYLIYFKLI